MIKNKFFLSWLKVPRVFIPDKTGRFFEMLGQVKT